MNLAQLLLRQARLAPERPDILNGHEVVASYGDWASRCAHLARQFQAAGLQPGDRVRQAIDLIGEFEFTVG